MEDNEIEIEETDSEDIDIEILDDRPEDDRVPARNPEAVGDEDFDADPSDLDGISKKVEKRLKRLKYEYHEERRAKEAALRERDAAVDFAKKVREYADRTTKTLEDGEKLLLSEVKKKADLSIASAKAKLKTALEEGDSDKAAEANSELIQAQMESSNADSYMKRIPNQSPRTNQPQPPAQQPSQRHLPTEEWKSKNANWYQKDFALTSYAEAYASEIERQGINAVQDPVKYFSMIDGEMKKRFPDRFNSTGSSDADRSASQAGRGTVKGVNRTSGASTRKVQLTASEIALAAKLGITKEQYAKEKLKQLNS